MCSRPSNTIGMSQGKKLIAEPSLFIPSGHPYAHIPKRHFYMIGRQRGEAPFGYLKQFGGLRRLTGHGLTFAAKKALIAGSGWNLLRLLKGAVAVSAAFAALSGILPSLLTLWEAIRGAVGGETAQHPVRALHSRNAGWATRKGPLSAVC